MTSGEAPAGSRPRAARRDHGGVESQIAEWRAYVSKAQAVNGRDIDELDAHLRDQIAELKTQNITTRD